MIFLILDYRNLYTGNLPITSGNWNNTSNAGTFYFNCNNSTSNTNSNITTSLTFNLC
jgi:hypothetical protein